MSITGKVRTRHGRQVPSPAGPVWLFTAELGEDLIGCLQNNGQEGMGLSEPGGSIVCGLLRVQCPLLVAMAPVETKSAISPESDRYLSYLILVTAFWNLSEENNCDYNTNVLLSLRIKKLFT